MTITFDMDGTLADFYGVENWLEYLHNEDTYPYEIAKPMINFSVLARLLNQFISLGNEVNICSWTAKNGSAEYNLAVGNAKIKWLEKHLPSVKFNKIFICDYGTIKSDYFKGILFDDNEEIRKLWGNGAYKETEIITVLKELLR